VTTDLAGLNRKLDNLADSLSKDTRKLLNQVGMEGKTIGRRGRPIQIALRFDIKSDTSVEMLPAPRAAGPMRVLEQGRRGGVSKGRKRKGRVGSTAGRGTWTTAVNRMADDLPKVVHRHTQATLRKLFS
jgi:hypothetical protein